MRLLDLTIFAAIPENKDRWPKLCGMADRLQSTHSIITDLRLAAGYVKAMRTLHTQTPVGEAPYDQGVLAGALFSAAIIAYARATTHSKHRKGLPFEKTRATAKLQDAHRQILQLRNNAIAHFGEGGEHLPAPWVKQRVVVAWGSRMGVSLPQRLFLEQSTLTNQLADLIWPALLFAEASEDEQISALLACLEASPDDALKAILKAPFDVDGFYDGDTDSIDSYRRNLTDVMASGHSGNRTAQVTKRHKVP